MKNIRVFTAAFASLLALSTVVARPAAAQVVDIVKLSLPYDVTIVGNSLPAGEYTIQHASESNGSPILMFRSDKGKTVEVLGMAISNPANSQSTRTEIVLEERGNVREIVKLWIQGQTVGYRFSVAD